MINRTVHGLGIAMAAVLAIGAASAADLSGQFQAGYTRAENGGAEALERNSEQLRIYLRDRLMVKNEWLLEYGLDRSKESGSSKALMRPRYATTLRGGGYVATLSFIPVRDDSARGGTNTDEWRGSLNLLGERWPQATINYLRRENNRVEGSHVDTWRIGLGLQRTAFYIRSSLDGRSQEAPERRYHQRNLTGKGELGLNADLWRNVRIAASADGMLGDRTGSVPKTSYEQGGGTASLGWTPAAWFDWSATGNARRSRTEPSGTASTTTDDRLVNTTVTVTPVSPLEMRAGYYRNSYDSGSLEVLQENVTAGLFGRQSVGRRSYVSAQASGGRQLASSAGQYDFFSWGLESGGDLYRRTTFRLSGMAQRNDGDGGAVVPLQVTRSTLVETEPYRSLRLLASYVSSYSGDLPGAWGSTSEVTSLSLSTHPRGLGSWTGTFTRSWSEEAGTTRYITLFGSTRTRRGLGLSLGYTRRTTPNNGAGVERIVESLQGRVEVELRNNLLLTLTRDESGVSGLAQPVEWRGTMRWSF